MRTKKIILTNFSRALSVPSLCIRPDNERQLIDYLNKEQPKRLLVRGTGFSYSDCCLNHDGLTIDLKHFNHFNSFDKQSGIVVCQPGITFSELLQLDKDYIPPVLPGTLHATLAGGLANDVHGKNNHHEQSFTHHVAWLELLINGATIRCSPEEHGDLFYATLAGLGLTGIIIRIALRLKKASHCVQVEHISYTSLDLLLDQMVTHGLTHDYQVAWLDLLQAKPRGLLSLANHCDAFPVQEQSRHKTPKIPFSVINKWTMKCFNQFYFHHKKNQETLSLIEFNNPLDKIEHWNYLYGTKGLLQFQAVFPKENALSVIENLIQIMNKHQATPTLAVLKLLTQSGEGLLSFCTPGFTLAIDFINNYQARQAIKDMNQLITNIQGRIYLAKDILLTPEQYELMYERHNEFSKVLADYQSPMYSDLGRRLGIVT